MCYEIDNGCLVVLFGGMLVESVASMSLYDGKVFVLC